MLNVSKCLKLLNIIIHHSLCLGTLWKERKRDSACPALSIQHPPPPGTPRPPIFKFWRQSFMICFFPILDMNQKRNDDKENEIDTEKKNGKIWSMIIIWIFKNLNHGSSESGQMCELTLKCMWRFIILVQVEGMRHTVRAHMNALGGQCRCN